MAYIDTYREAERKDFARLDMALSLVGINERLETLAAEVEKLLSVILFLLL